MSDHKWLLTDSMYERLMRWVIIMGRRQQPRAPAWSSPMTALLISLANYSASLCLSIFNYEVLYWNACFTYNIKDAKA